MSQPLLFEAPRDSLTRKQLIAAWKAAHGVWTCPCDHVPQDVKWFAIKLERWETRPALEVITQEIRKYDESGRTAEGATEAEAIRNLCRQLDIPWTL